MRGDSLKQLKVTQPRFNYSLILPVDIDAGGIVEFLRAGGVPASDVEKMSQWIDDMGSSVSDSMIGQVVIFPTGPTFSVILFLVESVTVAEPLELDKFTAAANVSSADSLTPPLVAVESLITSQGNGSMITSEYQLSFNFDETEFMGHRIVGIITTSDRHLVLECRVETLDMTLGSQLKELMSWWMHGLTCVPYGVVRD